MLVRILLAVLLVIAGLFVYAATRPDSFSVERSTRIEAPLPLVYEKIANFQQWEAWSPWEKLDPEMNKTYAGPTGAVGSSYAWVGNKNVGTGKITITAADPPLEISQRLEFVEPMASTSDVRFSLSPHGDGSVVVTWSMHGTNNLMSKLIGLFISTDEMIGKQFERGLADLKAISEQQAGR